MVWVFFESKYIKKQQEPNEGVSDEQHIELSDRRFSRLYLPSENYTRQVIAHGGEICNRFAQALSLVVEACCRRQFFLIATHQHACYNYGYKAIFLGGIPMALTTDLHGYIDAHAGEAFQLLLDLAQIPAPSNHEEQRAEFCLNWLRGKGAENAYTDEALNVIYPIGVTGENDLMVFMAHSDVVFPDTAPLPLKIENGRIYCPGVGDDTANAVALLTVAGCLAERKLTPKNCGILLVINSGEEGLGNLKGSRKIMEDFGSRVKEFVTFDGNADAVVVKAVGSRRYRVTVTTEGGHSYAKFGAPNAIAQLSRLIARLYEIQVPDIGRTTYNVGTISGGTSVNTIAQSAEMLYEFRSDEREGLSIMQSHFEGIVEEFRQNGVNISLEVVGDRPCGLDVDNSPLASRAAEAVLAHYGFDPRFTSGSTDCNIPLSLGIPAICPGCIMGAGAHTREEFVEISSLLPGLKVAAQLVLHHF